MGELPPGPRTPSLFQTMGWWMRPISFLERNRARYGKRFTIRLLGERVFVMLSDPADVKQVYTSPPDVLHPGEGARILAPVVGKNSVILLDGDAHLEQRKLMLPAFHGEKMQALSGLMREVAEREAEGWPRDEPVALHPRLQRLTLEVILRAVFGLDPGPRLDGLRERLTRILEMGSTPISMLPFLQQDLGGRGPWARFVRLREESDALIYELIEERRREDGDRNDVLSMLLAARHEDGSPMSDLELRDELMTLLVAGHETTASELAWGFERLTRSPAVLARLAAEIDSDDGDEYLTATVQEILRRRPVLPNTAPRLVKQPVNIGGWDYPPGVCVVANAYLVHHDPEIYPDPVRLPPGAVPGGAARHLHVDPVRGRAAPLPRRQLRAGRDEDRAASGPVALRGAARDRRRGGEPPAGHHGEPEPARHDRPARPARGARQRAPGGARGRARRLRA